MATGLRLATTFPTSWRTAQSQQYYSTTDRVPHIRFFVSRPDGHTWEDLSNYLSYAEVELGKLTRFGATIGVDQVVRQATFVLSHTRQMMPAWSTSLSAPSSRVVGQPGTVIGTPGTSGTAFINQLFGGGADYQWAGEGSFHPLDRRSPWNYWNGQYNPLLFSRRECILEVAFTPAGEQPGPYDWVRLFEGVIGDSIRNKGGGSVEFVCRDRAKLLMDSYIDARRTYGSESGVPAEYVIWQILTDNEWGAIADDLWVPVSPGFMIYPYEVDYQTPWDAIQEIAAQIGWFLGFRFRPTEGKFVLTFMEPPRLKGPQNADFILSARDEIIVQNLDISDVDIRNIVEVEFRNAATGDLETVTVQDDQSIALYGKRRMAIGEKDTVHIRTPEDATKFALRVLFDLSSLRGTTRIESRLLPSMDIFSGILVDDERLSSTVDFYGVESVRHVLDMSNPNGEHKYRTEVVASGKVIGGHAKWLLMETRRGAGMPLSPETSVGGGWTMPKPQITDANAAGILRGIKVDVPTPTVNLNRWVATEVHVSDTPGFTPSAATLADAGRTTHFEITATPSGPLKPTKRYYVRARYVGAGNRYGPYSNEISVEAGRPQGTVVIAASDANSYWKSVADYVCDGVDDQEEINEALSLTDTDVVQLSEGTFILSADLETTMIVRVRDGKTLEGQGPKTTLKLADGVTVYNVALLGQYEALAGGQNFAIRNLRIDGNKANITVQFEQVGIILRNCTNVEVSEVRVENCATAGVDIFDSNTILVQNCQATNIGGSGFSTNSSFGVRITNCVSESNGTGITAAGTANHDPQITNCRCVNNAGVGIAIASGGTVSQCECQGNGSDGIRSTLNGNTTIAQNRCIENGHAGIAVMAGTSQKDIHISGNYCKDNYRESGGFTGSANIFVNGTEIFVEGNVFRRTSGDNLFHGIRIGMNSVNVLVSNNDCYQGGSFTGISDSGTDTNFGAGNRLNDGTWATTSDD